MKYYVRSVILTIVQKNSLINFQTATLSMKIPNKADLWFYYWIYCIAKCKHTF